MQAAISELVEAALAGSADAHRKLRAAFRRSAAAADSAVRSPGFLEMLRGVAPAEAATGAALEAVCTAAAFAERRAAKGESLSGDVSAAATSQRIDDVAFATLVASAAAKALAAMPQRIAGDSESDAVAAIVAAVPVIQAAYALLVAGSYDRDVGAAVVSALSAADAVVAVLDVLQWLGDAAVFDRDGNDVMLAAVCMRATTRFMHLAHAVNGADTARSRTSPVARRLLGDAALLRTVEANLADSALRVAAAELVCDCLAAADPTSDATWVASLAALHIPKRAAVLLNAQRAAASPCDEESTALAAVAVAVSLATHRTPHMPVELVGRGFGEYVATLIALHATHTLDPQGVSATAAFRRVSLACQLFPAHHIEGTAAITVTALPGSTGAAATLSVHSARLKTRRVTHNCTAVTVYGEVVPGRVDHGRDVLHCAVAATDVQDAAHDAPKMLRRGFPVAVGGLEAGDKACFELGVRLASDTTDIVACLVAVDGECCLARPEMTAASPPRSRRAIAAARLAASTPRTARKTQMLTALELVAEGPEAATLGSLPTPIAPQPLLDDEAPSASISEVDFEPTEPAAQHTSAARIAALEAELVETRAERDRVVAQRDDALRVCNALRQEAAVTDSQVVEPLRGEVEQLRRIVVHYEASLLASTKLVERYMAAMNQSRSELDRLRSEVSRLHLGAGLGL